MIKQTKKVKMYYDEVIRLHHLGYSKSRICSILPLSYPTILKWISIFVESSNLNSKLMTKKTTTQRSKTSTNTEVYSTDVDELNARIKALEAQLEKSEIRAIAYDRLIDIAEEQFNIPIRKKAGTKR